MIKLNNNKITYVALADSANSIKAPKEIWYADSPNSVKLVYRRKDALIEGEDYEKYHWLEGRNGAYIDTNYYPVVGTDVFSLHFHYDGTMRNPDGVEQCIFGCQNGLYGPTVIRAYINSLNNLSVAYCSTSGSYYPQTGVNNNNWEITDLKLDGNNYLFIANGVIYTFSNNDAQIETMPNSIWVFKNKQAYNSNCYFHGDISYFKITDTSSNTKMRLIPCKLLKPVPKWLDANGIRRQVGECGMIDLVSGKFYGNVNSVGTFTVENYYERKEWLVGDGDAYIDTNIIVDVPSLVINATITKPNVTNAHQGVFGSRDNISYDGSHIFYMIGGKFRIDILTMDGSTIMYVTLSDINTITIDVPNGNLIHNGVSYAATATNFSVKNSTHTFKIFSVDVLGNANHPYSGSMSTFTLADGTHSLNLIPCTLTMDLPASMDANNIARTKGTSGMWDLVSDKFYGNVANSGTFKAVNLAEGVDYEVHQYLNFTNEGTKTIWTFMSLPIESDVVSFKRIYIDYPNNSIFTTGGNRYSYGLSASTMLIRVWDYDTREVSYSKPISTETTIRDIESTSTSLIINGVEITKYGFPIDSVIWRCSASHNCKNSSITVDGVERYIPVKLLKAIPSKYDANGIARNAGECGMYDTVNDVFYGNVASSGTFTVADDE